MSPLLPHPKHISGRWILVPFGDTVSQTNVLSFARINVVVARIGGSTDPPIPYAYDYTTPAQCWVQDLARGLNSSRSSWVQCCGRLGHTSRCFIVCSSPHSHVVCPSSLNPHFCISALPRPVPVCRRFRLDQVGHA